MTDTTWDNLTYDDYALDSQIAVDGDGTNEWNLNGTIESVNTTGLNLSMGVSQTIDQSKFGTNSGTIVVSGDITIGSNQFELKHSYTLEDSKKFIKIKTTLTNTGASSATNIRFWVGTRDDYIGSTDRPTKVRSNIVSSSLVTITTESQRSRALKISSNDEGVLFFTTYPKANTAVEKFSAVYFPATQIDPSTAQIETIDDGKVAGDTDSSYALFFRLNDLEQNESDSFTWYYAASPISEFNDIIDEVFKDTPPTLELTDNDSDGILISDDSVLVTATFNKAMAATPTVEIDGGILAPTTMSATSSPSVWEYTIDVNSLFSSEGIYSLSVTGSDTFGNSYSGTDSLTYRVDLTPPTLSSFTHDHDDLVVNGNETVIITATFNENMTSSPTISIGGNENDIDGRTDDGNIFISVDVYLECSRY